MSCSSTLTFREIENKIPTVTCQVSSLAKDEECEYRCNKAKWDDSLIIKEGGSPIFNKTFSKERFSFTLIQSVSEFTEKLPLNTDSSRTRCFRGQAATTLVLPSILRNPAYSENMQSMHNEVICAYPQEFMCIKHWFDTLALVRSKGLPANILDCTTNPMVALYHACKACMGDTATVGMVLSYTPASLHNANECKRIHNSSPLFIRSSSFNAQMANQQTVFLLFQNETFETIADEACTFNQNNLEKSIFLVQKKSAETILEELDELGIGDYQMDPEIENLTKSVKKKFTEKKKTIHKKSDTYPNEQYLEKLAMAYIERGYVSIGCFPKQGDSKSWYLSDTDSVCLKENEKKNPSTEKEIRNEELFNADCKGTIKLIQICTEHDGSWLEASLKEFESQLKDSIKARIVQRLEELENRRLVLSSMKGEQERERKVLENNRSAPSSEINNMAIGENYRWAIEIERLLKRLQGEKDFLAILKMNVAIQDFYPNGRSGSDTENWHSLLVYDPKRIKPIPVESAAMLRKEIDSFKKEKESLCKPYSLYYRGQPLQFPIEASLFRDKNYIKHEKDMYAELLARLPETFNKEPSIFDRLVVMKHYNFPSRLLDMTSNPLVALLFAVQDMVKLEKSSLAIQAVTICFSKKEEEKDILSDTVVRLCALPLVEDHELLPEKGLEEIDYLNEIKYRSQRYAPGYYPMQPCMEELDKAIVVHPSMNNKRVERQKGEFVLSGRNTEDPAHQNSEVNNFFFLKELSFLAPIPLFVVGRKDAESISTELKQHFGLDESYIYPEMNYKIEEIRNRYYTAKRAL